jgi:lipopolysaccharide/colanic/teichoic acid biosynthesis glycosyltransferase
MEIIQPELKELSQWIQSIEARAVPLSRRMLRETWDKGEGAQQASVQRGILDPKAARMFDFYARQGLQLAWENRRSRLILLAWLVYIQIQNNAKRAFDLAIALGGLPIVLPIMLFTAIVIKLESPGPVIFRQERVGKWGRRFICYKFRSMYIDAEARKAELMDQNEADEVVFKIKHDPRVTRVGRVIRKLSIDELPQVFNIIKGEMSIVGPRPPVPVELEYYEYDTFRRLDTIPGLTGLQQVSGRSDLSFKRWVELDVEYIRHQSMKKDIEILLKTIPAVISGKGAY